MRAVIQRVRYSQVSVDGKLISEIKQGFMVLLGVGNDDSKEDADYMIKKIPEIRIFEDSEDKMNLSIQDIKGEIQLISQFTLYGDARKGRRPSFSSAARPEQATELFDYVVGEIGKIVPVKTGKFGADMKVELLNDGPVTILLDSKRSF